MLFFYYCYSCNFLPPIYFRQFFLHFLASHQDCTGFCRRCGGVLLVLVVASFTAGALSTLAQIARPEGATWLTCDGELRWRGRGSGTWGTCGTTTTTTRIFASACTGRAYAAYSRTDLRHGGWPRRCFAPPWWVSSRANRPTWKPQPSGGPSTSWDGCGRDGCSGQGTFCDLRGAPEYSSTRCLRCLWINRKVPFWWCQVLCMCMCMCVRRVWVYVWRVVHVHVCEVCMWGFALNPKQEW